MDRLATHSCGASGRNHGCRGGRVGPVGLGCVICLVHWRGIQDGLEVGNWKSAVPACRSRLLLFTPRTWPSPRLLVANRGGHVHDVFNDIQRRKH